MPESPTKKKPIAIEQALFAIERYKKDRHMQHDATGSDDYVLWLKKTLPALSMQVAASTGEAWDAALLLEHIQKGESHIIGLLAQMKPQKITEKQPALNYDDVVKALPKEDNRTDLIKAIDEGDIVTLRRLIENGVDIHANDAYALRWAAQNGHFDVVKLLLDNGADIHAFCDYALGRAAENGHFDVMKLLLDNDADIHAGDNLALRSAAQNGHFDVVKLLLDNGADIHADYDYALSRAAENGHFDVVKLLLDNDADIHALHDFALGRAAQNGHFDVVKLLLDNDADIHAGDNLALRLAAKNRHFDVLELLTQGDEELKKKYLPDTEEYTQYKKWQRLHNDFKAPKALLNKNPYDFKLKTYLAVESFLNKEGYSGEGCATYAYNISTLLRTEDRVLNYLQKWGKAGKQPLHDCAQDIKIPEAANINYKDWGDAVLQLGPKMARLVKLSDRLDKPSKGIDGKSWSLKKTQEQAAAFVYDKASAHPQLATLCFDFDWDEDEFSYALKQVKKYKKLFAASNMEKSHGHIPDIRIDGTVFGKPDYQLYKLPDGDIRGLLLGEFTNCCQHLANQGAGCAKHGFLSEQGGFYVVAHKKSDEIIGQSWAWRGKKGELVLDSLESLSGHFNAQNWEQITQETAAQIAKENTSNISALHIGAGGATPRLSFNNTVLAKPIDYKGYRDSDSEQYLVAAIKPS